MRLLLAVLMMRAFLPVQSAAVSADTNTLTTTRMAHSLTAEDAARAYPVRIRGIAAYYERTSYFPYGEMFLLDSTGGVYVTLRALPSAPIHPGTLVEVEGVSGRGGYASQVDEAVARVIGESHLPAQAPLVTMEQLLSGAEDCKWVAIEGVVHSVEQFGDIERIMVEMNGGPIALITPREPGADYTRLIDATVRAHGNNAPTFNHHHQLTGTFLFLASLKNITVLKAAPPDPFALPVLPVDKILNFNPKAEYGHRIHIRGRLTLQWPGSKLCLTEAARGICAETTQTTPLRVGDEVDVVGFPEVGPLTPMLTDAIFRSAGANGALNNMPRITGEDILKGEYDSQLVAIEGQLIGRDWSEKHPIIYLSEGKYVYSAIFPEDSPVQQIQSLQVGSVLQITGICSVRVDSMLAIDRNGFAVPSSFRILLRTPQDVVVVSRPSWWTPQHALVACGIIAVVVLIAFFWIVMLRRRVEQQTRALRDSEERLRHIALHDALTGLPNRALLYDRIKMVLARIERDETGLGLLMVDLDGFKEINDSLGHGVGDVVLRAVANRLTSAVRKSDTVARIGGDEFIILLPELKTQDEVERLAKKIVAIISAPIEAGTLLIPVSASVGACAYPEGGTEIDSLLHSVDMAMYKAKSQGKNRYCLFNREIAPVGISNEQPAIF